MAVFNSAAAERLRKVEMLASRAGTPGEAAAARAAAERLRERLPRPDATCPQVSDRARRRIEALLNTVRRASRNDLNSIVFWAASVIRDARHNGTIDFEDVEPALAALTATAMQSGLGGWETQHLLHRTMTRTPQRGRR